MGQMKEGNGMAEKILLVDDDSNVLDGYHRRWRRYAPSRRGQPGPQWHAFPRRVPRVPPRRPRNAPPAPGGRFAQHRPLGDDPALSLQLYAGGRHEPLQVRVLW